MALRIPINRALPGWRESRSSPVPGWALITGASQGLGKACAEECARLGMDLLLVALPASGLEAVAHDITRRYGVRAACHATDLTAPGSAEALAQWGADHDRAVKVLINNAGIGYNSRFEDSTLDENEACILLNNLALVKITHLLLPTLKRQPRAFVLNVASLAAFFPMPYMPVYAPSKAFILSFSLALREELRGTGVSVSVLCPNGIRTNASCRAKIAAGGLGARLTCRDADQIAGPTISEMLAGKAVIVPGALNQAIMWAGRYVPRAAVSAVASRFWGQTARPPHEAQPQATPTRAWRSL